MVNDAEIAIGCGHTLLAAQLLVEFERFELHLLGVGKIALRSVADAEIAVGYGHALLKAQLLVELERFELHLLGAGKIALH